MNYVLFGEAFINDTLGWVYYSKRMYDQAIASLEEARDLNPQEATIHYHLGMAYYKKGMKERTLEVLKKALKLDGKFEGANEARRVIEELEGE